MNSRRLQSNPNPRAARWPSLPACAALLWLAASAALPLPASATEARNLPNATREASGSAGIQVQRLDSADHLGLPIYPGAKPARRKDDTSSGGSLGLWGGSFGMQLHTFEMRSADPVASVAAFYRQALAADPTLLDCSQPAPAASATPPAPAPAPPAGRKTTSTAGDEPLRCGNDKPPPGGHLFKTGTSRRMGIVTLEPLSAGTRIQLLRLDVRGDGAATTP